MALTRLLVGRTHRKRLRAYAEGATRIEVAVAFLGVTLVGAVYMALGLFASSLSRSQIIAAMMAFLMGIALWMLGVRPPTADGLTGAVGRAMDHVSLVRQMEDFARGILDSRHVVFCLSLTQRVVEGRRWK